MNDWDKIIPGSVFRVACVVERIFSSPAVESMPLKGCVPLEHKHWPTASEAMLFDVSSYFMAQIDLQLMGVTAGCFHEKLTGACGVEDVKQIISIVTNPLTAIAKSNTSSGNIICITPKCGMVIVSPNITLRCQFESSKRTTKLLVIA